MLSVFDLLGSKGPFAELLQGFAPRIQQQEMASAVETALDQHQVLVAEAGTGTGKTFAYLVPALLSAQYASKKVIISTGTKNLQDQLFYRDLPLVKKALKSPVKTALLKGRANYFCHYRFEQKQRQGRLTWQQLNDFSAIKNWLPNTKMGDIAELGTVPEDASIWPLVTSSADNCLGSDCEYINDCYVNKARRLAQQADVVVVNHHLFFADMALRDEGFGEVLPGANAFVFDEAHQLAHTAQQFFGSHISSRLIFELCKDSRVEMLEEAADVAEAGELADALEKAVKELRLALGEAGQRVPWEKFSADEHVVSCFADMQAAGADLELCLKESVVRSSGIESCWRRASELLHRLSLFQTEETDSQALEQADEVIWLETHSTGFTLHQTPTDVSEPFSQYLSAQEASWIFTSATLSVSGHFDHFSQALGLDQAVCYTWDSPFDFSRQSLLFVPEQMPEPNTSEYLDAVVNVCKQVLDLSEGRAFILVTSYRALNEISRQLQGKIDYPLLVQGELSKGELLESFRREGNAVLLATSSFWEGVDVKGSALSCVIIDKLPFAAPDDPILQARIDAMAQEGKNAFMEIQLPRAVISLKQGVGRLIRDVKDTGALVICDPRTISKSYGKVFLNSLPQMTKTRKLERVAGFFQYCKTLETTGNGETNPENETASA